MARIHLIGVNIDIVENFDTIYELIDNGHSWIKVKQKVTITRCSDDSDYQMTEEIIINVKNILYVSK